MDGVLIDSQDLHYLGDQMTLQAHGIQVPLKDLEQYAGTTNDMRFRLYREKYGLTGGLHELIAEREETMLRLIRESDRKPIKGIPQLLDSIEKAGLRRAVASSSSYNFVYAVLDKIGLRDCFELVLSGEDFARSKPYPDVFLESAARLGLSHDSCAVIEDSGSGALAAKRAGMSCMGYINPTSGKQDLGCADLLTDDFSRVDAQTLINMTNSILYENI